MKGLSMLTLIVLTITMGHTTGARYLIITHDDFHNAVVPLAEWKHKKGMRSKIAKLSEIGADSIALRNYIANAYNTWTIKPEYLLLVGAPNFLPLPRVNGTYSDNYYTNIQGDMYNEILSGRVTAHDSTEAQTVINKILTYERTPHRADSLWFRKACLIVNCDYDPDDSIYWSDAHYAAALMVAAGFVEIDTFSDASGDNADSVIEAVNNGRSVVMYRGQGFNNWEPPFDVDPDLTQNDSKLPIVLSITCQTMGTGSTPAVAERWFLTGTPANPRGASGYFATTTSIVGQAYLRSAVAKGFHHALFNENKNTFGASCEGGRIMAYTMFPYQGGAAQYLGFTTLGDPEMNIWTDTPCSLICSHPDTIPIGGVNFSVNVSQAGDLSPVSEALVCMTANIDSTIYAMDTTDSSGNAHFVIEPHFTSDSIHVTVTGQNLQPYEGSMITSVSGVYIAYLKSNIDDSLGGNNDGLVNPGEEINLPLWVKNYGDSTGIDITGILQVADTYTTITDSLITFGDIQSGDSVFTGEDGYDFTVAANCTDGHRIDFDLMCHDIDDSVWVSRFNVPVHSAELTFQDAAVSGGNGNNSFEPGETVTVVVTLKNQGSVAIDSVAALLHSLSTYVVIIDSNGNFDHIAPDSSASNSLDAFTVYSDPSTPQGTLIDFQMIISADYYVDTIPFALIIGKHDYYIWNPDQTPASGENMHSILTSLGYSGDYGTNLAADLSHYTVVFVCVGVFPNNYVIGANSPEAVALTDFANSGGRLYLEGGDVWYFDPLASGYDFGPLFGIDALADGTGDLGPIVGESGTFTAGMDFTYSGENNYVDKINPTGTGFLIFHDGDDNYDCGVANRAGTYRTVGTSFELGLLDDGSPPSTRAALLDSIMSFLAFATVIMEKSNSSSVPLKTTLEATYPNPFKHRLAIAYCIADVDKREDVFLKIYDVTGRLVRSFNHVTNLPFNQVIWNGRDNVGRQVPAGVYFVQLTTSNFVETESVVLLK